MVGGMAYRCEINLLDLAWLLAVVTSCLTAVTCLLADRYYDESLLKPDVKEKKHYVLPINTVKNMEKSNFRHLKEANANGKVWVREEYPTDLQTDINRRVPRL